MLPFSGLPMPRDPVKTKKSKVHKTPESHVDLYSSSSDSSVSEAEDERPKRYIPPHRPYKLNPYTYIFVPRRSPRLAEKQNDNHVYTFTVHAYSVAHI